MKKASSSATRTSAPKTKAKPVSKKSSSPAPKAGSKIASKVKSPQLKKAPASKPVSDKVEISREAREKPVDGKAEKLQAGLAEAFDLGDDKKVAEPKADSKVAEPKADDKVTETKADDSEAKKLEGTPITVDGPIINPEPKPGDEKRPDAIVLDDFKSQIVDIDRDGQTDTSHGAVSASALHNDGFDVTGYHIGLGEKDSVADGVSKFEKDLKAGKLDVRKGTPVQMSFGQDFDMAKFNKQFGLNVTPENIGRMRPQIRKSMEQFAAGETKVDPANQSFDIKKVKDELSVMNSVENIQKMGHPVVAAASNTNGAFSPAFLNADKLTAGINEVDKPIIGTDPTAGGITKEGGERHALTTDIPGVFQPRPVNGGMSTNGDSDLPEFPSDALSNNGKVGTEFNTLVGASYAPPFAIRWAEQSGEYFPGVEPLKNQPKVTELARFNDAADLLTQP